MSQFDKDLQAGDYVLMGVLGNAPAVFKVLEVIPQYLSKEIKEAAESYNSREYNGIAIGTELLSKVRIRQMLNDKFDPPYYGVTMEASAGNCRKIDAVAEFVAAIEAAKVKFDKLSAFMNEVRHE